MVRLRRITMCQLPKLPAQCRGHYNQDINMYTIVHHHQDVGTDGRRRGMPPRTMHAYSGPFSCRRRRVERRTMCRIVLGARALGK